MTILLVEQNLAAALEIATRGYVIETGEMKMQGSAAELREDPKIRAAYLGL
jgi:branched-chain amino acid transport system ATP-binding protein